MHRKSGKNASTYRLKRLKSEQTSGSKEMERHVGVEE